MFLYLLITTLECVMLINCLEMLILGIKVKCYFFYYILVKWSSCRPKDKVILSFTVMLEERMQGYEGLHVSCRSLHLHLWADQYQQSFTWLPFKPVQFDLKKKRKKKAGIYVNVHRFAVSQFPHLSW